MRSAGDPAGSGLKPVATPVSAAEFAHLLDTLGPFGPAPRVVAGVSGGPHSLALALLASAWIQRRGGSLVAAICDHGLRPESAAEAEGVAAMLAQRGIAARILSLRVGGGAALQARARAARLDALLGLCAALGAPWLLLGHHRADQAETVLMRAVSGSGPAGLAAMWPARVAGAALVLRPLLGVPPARLEAVVAQAGLAPVRDPSNADARFDRVRLRAALHDPGGEGAAIRALADAARRFAARRATQQAAVAARLAEAAILHDSGFARIDPVALGHGGVARAALGALIRAGGGGAYPPPAAALHRLLARGEGTLAGVVLRRTGLLLREAAAVGPPVPACPGACWDGRFLVSAVAESGLTVGAAGEGARRLSRPAWMPGGAVPTLPALYRNGMLVAVPALAYPDAQAGFLVALSFAPRAGPVA